MHKSAGADLTDVWHQVVRWSMWVLTNLTTRVCACMYIYHEYNTIIHSTTEYELLLLLLLSCCCMCLSNSSKGANVLYIS
jgi:uncharacterized membrane protein YwaF